MELKDKCIAEFELYTNIEYDETNKVHVSIVEDMIEFKKCQLNSTGYSYLSVNGINETYKNDYPKPLLRALSSLKKRVKLL